MRIRSSRFFEYTIRICAVLFLLALCHVGFFYTIDRVNGFLMPAAGNKSAVYVVVQHITSFVLAIAACLTFANFYVYHGFRTQPDIFRRGDKAKPWVALTFDDGPSPEYTRDIIRLLERYDVPATFFMIGSQVELYDDIARDVALKGHEIGNHTWSHINVPTTETHRLYEEMLRTSFVIYEKTGVYPAYSRPPRGIYDGRYRRLSQLLGHKVVLWTLSARDWQDHQRASVIVKRIVDRVRPGDILLFHDSGGYVNYLGGKRAHTVEALEAVIQGVRNKQLEFVPLNVFLSGTTGESSASDHIAATKP